MYCKILLTDYECLTSLLMQPAGLTSQRSASVVNAELFAFMPENINGTWAKPFIAGLDQHWRDMPVFISRQIGPLISVPSHAKPLPCSAWCLWLQLSHSPAYAYILAQCARQQHSGTCLCWYVIAESAWNSQYHFALGMPLFQVCMSRSAHQI